MNTQIKAVLFVLLVLASASPSMGQKIVLPADNPGPGDWCQIMVEGLSDADMEHAVVDYYPRKNGLGVIPAKTWAGLAMLMVQVPEDAADTYPIWIVWPKSATEVGYLYAELNIDKGSEPDPKPDPKPDPNESLSIAIFRDGQEVAGLNNDQLTVLNGLDFRKELADKGITLRGVFDVSSAAQSKWPSTLRKELTTKCYGGRCQSVYVYKRVPTPGDPELAKWFSHAKDSQLPAVVVWGEKSGWRSFTVPETIADFWKEIGE